MMRRLLAGLALCAALLLAGGADAQQVYTSPLGAAPITNSLAADVNLNNTGQFFDGPSVAQGTSGTWFASGTITVLDTVGTSTFNVKLWDGTTVIASAQFVSSGTNAVSASLSGYLASPAGNIRISAQDAGSANGKIKAAAAGIGNTDSTISAIRIK